MVKIVRDPVCGMPIDRDHAFQTATYGGRTYYLCDATCARLFARDPDKFVRLTRAADAATDADQLGRGSGDASRSA